MKFHALKRKVVAAFERHYIADLLEKANGNVSLAARRAGLDRVHLYRLMRKHRVTVQRTRATPPGVHRAIRHVIAAHAPALDYLAGGDNG